MDQMREEMQARWNSEGWRYDEAPAHGTDSEKDRLQWGEIFSRYPKEARILDVGTGTGFVAIAAAKCGLDVTGVDWSQTMLSQAKDKAAASGLVVNWVLGLTETLPFPDDCFDILTARHVVWTLVEPVKIFSEWRRVLKPGGRVYADYSPRKGDHAGKHYSEEIERKLPLNRDVQAVEVSALFSEAGFNDVSFTAQEREINHEDHVHRSNIFIFTGTK
ncbi:ubiquinone/menaquinone biosynthesis methyltransferase UbiE [Treponema primitia ZAS-2]|uniref:Ubiquinone/menaquinone biosynthesis methyltransferase UbiE n=1 Tax=Treponema primitia (strain ATCC BAA-887 / DSM 12427 / ZAS-2) TaxID=545694 RepID=F5YKU3_TREPZ|nr:class I SAM-dependent methyltransferase [Treponema primitia]AEF85022.1 ubiquinone/menaquinone biosynthesis methyltransferase UbiE [Treponema primitia ZAS-2]